MNIINKIWLTLSLIFTGIMSNAQAADPNAVEMADVLHQNGKIYLVVLVLVTIFAGIIFLLLRIERKLNRLENKQENKQS
jgi:glycerol-3-phosphate acyltransferase PlsY